MTAMDAEHAELAAFKVEVQTFLAGELDDPAVVVTQIERSAGGHSWETYLVTATSRANRLLRLVAKRQPSVGMIGSYDVQREVDLLKLARKVGIPAPDVIGSRSPTEGGRGFYVTSFVDGAVPLPATLLTVVPDPDQRRSLGLELARYMAQLHTYPIAQVPDGVSAEIPAPEQTGSAAAERWRTAYRQGSAIRLPVLDLALAWLDHHAGDVTGELSLIHNDLHVGNFIADGGRVAAVLDWETAEISDPAGDIAKFNLPTWQGGTGLSSGLLPLADLLEEYGRHGGSIPAPAALRFWTILSLTKSATIMLTSSVQFEAGRHRDIRWGNLGFRMLAHMRLLVDLLKQEDED